MARKKTYMLALRTGSSVEIYGFETKKQRDVAIKAIEILNEGSLLRTQWAITEV